MSGRHQINASGISLFDGVPFGRPPARARSLVRPKVYIPPRKRRRLTYEDDGYGIGDGDESISLTDIDGTGEQLLLVNSGEAMVEQPKIQTTQKQKTTRKADKSVRFSGVLNENMAHQPDDEQFEEANINGRAKPISKMKVVRFADEDMDDEDDEDFDPHSIGDEDSMSDEEFSDSEASEFSDTNSTSESDSDSNSDSDSDSDSDLRPATEAIQKPPAKNVNFQKGHSTNEPQNGSGGHGTSNNGEGLVREKHEIVSRAPPGQGQKRTQIRNKRRHLSKKLRKLQSTGILPPNATVRDLKDWLGKQEGIVKTPLQDNLVIPSSQGKTDNGEQGNISSDSSSHSSDSESENEGAEHLPMNELANQKESTRSPTTTTTAINGFAKLPELLQIKDKPTTPTNHKDELEERRQKLLTALGEKEKIVNQQESNGPTVKVSRPASVNEPSMMEHPRKRQRTSVEVANRMIFANLGLRAPKTEAEAEAVKEKLKNEAKGKKLAVTPTTSTSLTTTEVLPESDSWKSKISLSAVECCNDGIVLSEPPYPFTQRWDPQQQDEYDQNDLNGSQGRNKKNSKNSYHYTDEFEEHDGVYDAEPDDTITILNYDEETRSPRPMDDNISTNVIDDITVDDLPLLPTAVDTLKTLAKEDISPGAIVAFKLLEVSKATNWAPGISHYRTAKILHDDDLDEGTIKMELAIRDREKAEYDEQGKRIFGKFEMVVDEDEQDDGIRILNFRELVEPKLIQTAVLAKVDDEQNMEDIVKGKDKLDNQNE